MKIGDRALADRLQDPERIDGLAASLFWAWNIVFLAFVFLGFVPNLLSELLAVVDRGELPTAFLVWGSLLMAIPVLAVAIGLTRLREQPRKLFGLGYGVEAPLMMVVGLRFFAIRQLTAAVTLLIAVAGAGILTFLWQLLDRHPGDRGDRVAMLRLVGLSMLMGSGLYAAAWIGFYALPIAVGMLDIVGEMLGSVLQDRPRMVRELWAAIRAFEWHALRDIEWVALPLVLLGAPLFALSAVLVVAMPVTISLLYIGAWRDGFRRLAQRQPAWRPALLGAGTLVLLALLFVAATRQPQHRAFALLATPPQTVEQAEDLLERAPEIREGLLNSYLAPQRYFSARGEVRHVMEMYYNGPITLEREQAERVRELYEQLASPLLYQPAEEYSRLAINNWQSQVFVGEPKRAAQLYAAFFDQPIAKAERHEIVRAVQSTWNIDQARDARLQVDDLEVHIARQGIDVSEHGDWAEVEIHEVYDNMTFDRQEVVYWFSLPETAVVTGIWLGESEDPAERHAFRVAPRGAAQQVYREEVQRRIDPALIEQIGPRQYRLRVFPILPRRHRHDGSTGRGSIEPGPAMHMWLRYLVFAESAADGSRHWPLPRLADLRNVYWDEQTVLSRSDDQVRLLAGGAWQDTETIEAELAGMATSHRVDFADGRSVLVRPADPEDLVRQPEPWRLALVLDSSGSMAGFADAVGRAVQAAEAFAAGKGELDIFLTASAFSGQAPRRFESASLDVSALLYFGGQNAAELLIQYDDLRGVDAYDAVLVLTDGSGYELGAPTQEIPVPEAPVWMVHLGGGIPMGYDDGTLAAIQASGGGVAGSMGEALDRLAYARRGIVGDGQASAATRDLLDGYVWSVVATAQVETSVHRLRSDPEAASAFSGAQPSGIAALAARRLILSEMHDARADLDRLPSLDRLHSIAVEQGIVTPYSSMIVLVNERQHQRLDALERDPARFERELEAVGASEEVPMAVNGVPEPDEWLLLALAAVMLWWQARQRQRQQPPARVHTHA